MMLNITGSVEGLDQDVTGKSAFMELQQQPMPPGMAHPAYPIRSTYPTHQSQHENVFSTAQHTRPFTYPFAMNTMSASTYNPPTHPFSVTPYQTTSPTREERRITLASISSGSGSMSVNRSSVTSNRGYQKQIP
uniref:Uncharacterized protein n=1 Tax=Octopus bimaculoides TaxID=37653 RepID=A0A0L8G8R3_OCTBM